MKTDEKHYPILAGGEQVLIDIWHPWPNPPVLDEHARDEMMPGLDKRGLQRYTNVPAGAIKSIARIRFSNARFAKLKVEWYIVCLALGNLTETGSSINGLKGCNLSAEKTSSRQDLSATDGLKYLNESFLEFLANM